LRAIYKLTLHFLQFAQVLDLQPKLLHLPASFISRNTGMCSISASHLHCCVNLRSRYLIVYADRDESYFYLLKYLFRAIKVLHVWEKNLRAFQTVVIINNYGHGKVIYTIPGEFYLVFRSVTTITRNITDDRIQFLLI